MCEPQKVVIFSHLVFMVNRLTKIKSREKRDITALDFKKSVFYLYSLDRILG